MRRPTRNSILALPFAALALAAGCGGGQVAVEEVPGSPPALTVPTDSELGAGGSNADASSSTSADESGDSSGNADTSGSGTADSATPDAGATPAPPTDTGAAAPTPEPTTAPEDTTGGTQPPPGSPPQEFENFCEQNAGAC